jgi:hypothetical protein
MSPGRGGFIILRIIHPFGLHAWHGHHHHPFHVSRRDIRRGEFKSTDGASADIDWLSPAPVSCDQDLIRWFLLV